MLGYLPTDPALDLLSFREYLVGMHGRLAWAHLQANATATAVGTLFDEKLEGIRVNDLFGFVTLQQAAAAARIDGLRQRRSHWFEDLAFEDLAPLPAA